MNVTSTMYALQNKDEKRKCCAVTTPNGISEPSMLNCRTVLIKYTIHTCSTMK